MTTIVVALGGNAILQRGQQGTAREQLKNLQNTSRQIAQLIRESYRVVITHGNGPQVGNILIQNELGETMIPRMPMDICGAQSQGMIGYMLQMSIGNALREHGMNVPVTSVITQTLVDRNDPAFQNPTKPVGPFKDYQYAMNRQQSLGETWIEDSGRGWRRVVPSPEPKEIIEAASIRKLVEAGHAVVSVGGGGIPVVMGDSGMLEGVEAVVDKDLGAERLAHAVGASILLILTDVPGACLNFRTPQEQPIGSVSLDELMRYEKEGHFRAGSMGPKVKAIIRFVQRGGEIGIVASLDEALPALKGQAGTRVTR
ncbi:MAG: carbamate kinase [Bacillota bacterium]